MEGRDVLLEGVIANLPQRHDRGTRFLFHVEDAPMPVPRTLLLAWYSGIAEPAPTLMPGERWRLGVRLKRPRGVSNPHGFDFETWALARGIRATGYVRPKAAERLEA